MKPTVRPCILIDCSFITVRLSCVSSHYLYAGMLLRGFRAYSPFRVVALVVEGMEEYVDELAGGQSVEKIVISASAKVLSKKLDRLLGLVPFRKALEQQHVDAVITPYTTPFVYVYPKQFRQHAIIHDLIAYHQGLGWPRTLMMKCVARRVPRLIAISEHTKDEVRKAFGREAAVVYNSIPMCADNSEQPVADVDGRAFILDVNRFERYKNAETLVRALHRIREQIPHMLYLKGYNSVSSDMNYLRQLIHALDMDDRVILDSSHRTEAEMRWLYSHASLFVSPSIEEGFGYTPIEAAIRKAPVLVSDIATLREVTQGRVPTFNPHDAGELASKMLNILTSPPSIGEREAIAAFYIDEYSLQKQIARFQEVLLSR